MSSIDPAPDAAPDPNLAAAIARAELGRAMLERLAVIGMALAEEIGERAVNSPYHPEPRHEPGRSFASVSRAVRLTVALIMRLDTDIIAMRNGTFTPPSKKPASGFGVGAAVVGSASDGCPGSKRDKVRGAVWDAINREVGDLETAVGTLDRVHERLIENEDYDEYLRRPWRECVEAICADLGLDPDWSAWSDDVGFPKFEAGSGHDWPRLWTYDPARLKRPPPDPADPRRGPGVERTDAQANLPA